MNDFDWDALQKKRIAQGEKHRKKRQRGCTLPTDFMTNRQIQKMHGEVISMNINEPITWQEFKKLSKDTQELYYNSIVERFGVGQTLIGRHLFHVPQATLSLYQHDKGLNLKRAVRATKGQVEAFVAFCNKESPAKPIEPVEVVEPVEPAEPVVTAEPQKAQGFKYAEFVFDGIELEEIARTLKFFIPKDARITIRAEVR